MPTVPGKMIPKPGQPRGVLRPNADSAATAHGRFAPSPDLAPFIEHFWTVAWHLEGHPPKRVETLPHPSVHLVFENGATGLGGPSKGKFSRLLEGDGFVFAAKFRPASFHGFYGKPVSELTNKIVDPGKVFGKDFAALDEQVLSASSSSERVALTEDYLRLRLPAADADADRLNNLLLRISSDRLITRVEHLPSLFGGTVRRLQRLFSRYIGVSPKWVIARYRIHEALQRVEERREESWTALALELGYSDQAHFIRDFKALVGSTPVAYQDLARRREIQAEGGKPVSV